MLPVAAIALIDQDQRILLAQRPLHKHMGGMWEFPGGKIEPGETPEGALMREVKEELGIVPCESCITPVNFVSHAYEGFHLLMLLYACRRWEGQVQSLEGQALTWKTIKEMRDLPMPPADAPLISALRDFLGTPK